MNAEQVDQMDNRQNGYEASGDQDGRGWNEARVEAAARPFFQIYHGAGRSEAGGKYAKRDSQLCAHGSVI